MLRAVIRSVRRSPRRFGDKGVVSRLVS